LFMFFSMKKIEMETRVQRITFGAFSCRLSC
jgi:hypothetical protein